MHGGCLSRVLPFIYVLMSNKCDVLYENIFRKIKRLFILKPTYIILYFEKVIANAVEIIVEIKVLFCYFNINLSSWVKLQKTGLSGSYLQENAFKNVLKNIYCISYDHQAVLVNIKKSRLNYLRWKYDSKLTCFYRILRGYL